MNELKFELIKEKENFEEGVGKMDKMILNTKHLTVYFSTLQIGIGISYVTEHKEVIINLGVIEINIR